MWNRSRRAKRKWSVSSPGRPDSTTSTMTDDGIAFFPNVHAPTSLDHDTVLTT
jgi:hypothetical protein